MRLDREILDIIDRYEKAGHEVYVVGGSLRDRLLGREAFDTDMTTSALPEQTLSLFSDMRVIPTGIKHGTVTVLTPTGVPVEVTTYRTDGSYSDSRHPDSVTFTGSLSEDLARRDFTVNAMAYSPKRGVVDLFEGEKDLKAGVIRCVGDPEKRFTEDVLRILRAFRFSAQLAFEIEEETLSAALRLGGRISLLARERVAAELTKLLGAPKIARVLEKMVTVMPYVLPGVALDPDRFELCDFLPPDPVARLALLVYGGDADGLAVGLRMSTADRMRMRALSLPRKIPRSEGDVRRLMAEMQSLEDCALAVRIAGLIKAEDVDEVVALIGREAERSPCLSISGLAVSGADLMEIGVEKGRQMGEILRRLLDAVIETPELNDRERLLDMARKLNK